MGAKTSPAVDRRRYHPHPTMRLKDWEILQVGDRVTRVQYERDRTKIAAGAPTRPPVVTQCVDFQVVQIRDGRATVVRLLSTEVRPGMRTTRTEVVELEITAATAESPTECVDSAIYYTWEWNAPARGEARLTGGFVITRADGSVERDRCPTDTTR